MPRIVRGSLFKLKFQEKKKELLHYKNVCFPQSKARINHDDESSLASRIFLLASGPNQHKTYRQSFPHMLRLNIV